MFDQISIVFLLIILALGFTGGLLAGLLGVGGGIVFVPLFQEIAAKHPIVSERVDYVIANSLLVVFIVGISGSIKHIKLKNTHLKAALTTGLSAVFSSLILSYTIKQLGLNNPQVFKWLFSIILVFTGIRMWSGKKQEEQSNQTVIIPPLKQFIPAGLIAGCITALTGLGGGIIMIPYFNKINKLPLKFATGLSLTVIPILAFPLLSYYALLGPTKAIYNGLQTGYILWPIALPMVLAASIASPLGIKIAQKIPSKTLLIIFTVFIVLTILKTLLT